MKRFWLLVILILICGSGFTQSLKAGFDKDELLEVMYVSARTGGNDKYVNNPKHPIPEPSVYTRIYRSEEIGFYNLWELWTAENNTAIITIRGTTGKNESWLTNFYAAMIPAQGEIILPDSTVFEYAFSNNPLATVHTGWTISTAYLSSDILPRIDSVYKQGIREFIITGHSQGGAISCLLTAHLINLKERGLIPDDIQFKTYSTAAPRVGNLFFAYDFEQKTQGGWAFTVVNPLDWVPEMPLSVQTTRDFNKVNPFSMSTEALKRTKPPKRIALKHIYRKLTRHPAKAEKNYRKFLGQTLGKSAEDFLGTIKLPEYSNNMNYARTGQSFVLSPDQEYHNAYPEEEGKIFIHHSHHAYIFLINSLHLQ